jgi:SSS family solute:Na+ symporter
VLGDRRLADRRHRDTALIDDYSVSAIFTFDLYRALVGSAAPERLSSHAAIAIAFLAERPLLAGGDQVFQNILEYTDFLAPGIVAIYSLGQF